MEGGWEGGRTTQRRLLNDDRNNGAVRLVIVEF